MPDARQLCVHTCKCNMWMVRTPTLMDTECVCHCQHTLQHWFCCHALQLVPPPVDSWLALAHTIGDIELGRDWHQWRSPVTVRVHLASGVLTPWLRPSYSAKYLSVVDCRHDVLWLGAYSMPMTFSASVLASTIGAGARRC